MIILYNLLATLNALFFFGNLYCAWKIYGLKHPWRRYVGITYAVNALIGLAAVTTLGLGPRPVVIIWWRIALSLTVYLIAVGATAFTTLFFMGFLNGHAEQSEKGTTDA